MIHLIETNKPTRYFIKDDDIIIGKLITESGGIIYMKQKEPYRKLNAFGINKQLLFSKDIKFHIVLVECQGTYYMTRKKNIIAEGIEQSFPFGVKLFLPIPQWHSTTDKQLMLDFYAEGANK